MSLREVTNGAVSPDRYVRWTRGALWSLTIIVVSGGAVRLTGSGLGCSDWPNCEEDQFVADLEYHALIEFVNRLFTGVVTAAVVLAVLGSLRRVPRRHDLVRWSWGLVAGVAAQIILGAVLVKTDLDPRFTMGHFLLSMVLLWNAVVLVHLAGRPDDTQPPPFRFWFRPTVPDRKLMHTIIPPITMLGAVLLTSGTIVTGSGPHSGSDEAEVAARLPFLVREVTRVHSLIALLTIACVLIAMKSAHDHGQFEMRRRAAGVAVVLTLQGAVGYWQYFSGVPVLLVGVHMTLACLAWIGIVRMHLSLDIPSKARIPDMVR